MPGFQVLVMPDAHQVFVMSHRDGCVELSSPSHIPGRSDPGVQATRERQGRWFKANTVSRGQAMNSGSDFPPHTHPSSTDI